MKKLIIIGAIAAAMASYALTPAEIAALPKYTQFTNELQNADKQEVFDACIAANTFQCYNRALQLINMTSNDAWQVQLAEATIGNAMVKSNQNNFVYTVLIRNDLYRKDTQNFIRLCDKALDSKDYVTALAGLIVGKNNGAWVIDEPAEVKEWKLANYEEILKALAADDTNFSRAYYSTGLFSISRYDLAAKDPQNTIAMKAFVANVYAGKNIIPAYSGYYTSYELSKASNAAFWPAATNPTLIWKAACKLNSSAEKKAKLIEKWNEVKQDPAVALKAALFLNDVDKIIDSLLASTDNLDAATIEKIIAPLNSVDADYRKDDILKVLKNINSKYTIKLYDDRDVWEPVLSKIRAMADVRM